MRTACPPTATWCGSRRARVDPLEDEGVKLVGADIALGAAPLLAACAEGIAVAALDRGSR